MMIIIIIISMIVLLFPEPCLADCVQRERTSVHPCLELSNTQTQCCRTQHVLSTLPVHKNSPCT